MTDERTATVAEVRAWAIKNGLDVGRRGRIPREVTEAYNRGHRVKFEGSPYRHEAR